MPETDQPNYLRTLSKGCCNCGRVDANPRDWQFYLTYVKWPNQVMNVWCPQCEDTHEPEAEDVAIPMGVVAIHDHPVVVEEVQVTPALAADWLRLVRAPFPSYPDMVALFVNMLLDGVWLPHTLANEKSFRGWQPMRFYTDGYVYYGVQRLEAVLLSGVTMDALVERPATEFDPAEHVRPALIPWLGDGRPQRSQSESVVGNPVTEAIQEALASTLLQRALTPPTYKWMRERAAEVAIYLANMELPMEQTLLIATRPLAETSDLLSPAMSMWLEKMAAERVGSMMRMYGSGGVTAA